MKTSPTQRSLALLRKEGWLCAITERWNQFARIRQDLFGFVDLLAVRGDELLAIQTTSGGNAKARIKKIQGIPAAKIWLASPHRKLVVHAWAKRGPRGSVKRWSCHTTPLTLDAETKEIIAILF